MIKNNKRGISTIIATVLIVLITVAAVTILWAAVSPLIDQGADLSCFEVASAVSIDNGGFTEAVGDVSDDHRSIAVRVERGANSDALQGFEVIVDVDGQTLNDGMFEITTGLPTANGAKVYNFTTAGTPQATDISLTGTTFDDLDENSVIKVSLAPMVEIDGAVTTCDAGGEVTIRNEVTA